MRSKLYFKEEMVELNIEARNNIRILDFAIENNIHQIRLHVEKLNSNAIGLYQRLGYKIANEEGSRCLMVKILGE